MSLTKSESKELESKIKAIYDKNSGKHSRDNRINGVMYGLMGLSYLVLIALAAVSNSWHTVIFAVAMGLWVLVVWIQSKTITMQRFVIDTQHDLRDLEHRELRASFTKEIK